MMRILVTGTSGYLGGALARVLRQEGHEVFTISGRLSFCEQVDAVFKERVDVVIHAGFQVNFSSANSSTLSTSVENTRYLGEAAQKQNSFFIFLSAAAVLGVASDASAARSESDFSDQVSHRDPFSDFLNTQYVRDKVAAENALRAIPSLRLCSLYLTTTYGPGMQEMVAKKFIALLKPMRKIWLVPPGGTSFLTLDDLFRSIRWLMENPREGSFVLNSGNLSYHELFSEVSALGFSRRIFLTIPKFAIDWLAKAMQRMGNKESALLRSSKGYKYYSPERWLLENGPKPKGNLRESLRQALNEHNLPRA